VQFFTTFCLKSQKKLGRYKGRAVRSCLKIKQNEFFIGRYRGQVTFFSVGIGGGSPKEAAASVGIRG
jgi:hypothetical protein